MRRGIQINKTATSYGEIRYDVDVCWNKNIINLNQPEYLMKNFHWKIHVKTWDNERNVKQKKLLSLREWSLVGRLDCAFHNETISLRLISEVVYLVEMYQKSREYQNCPKDFHKQVNKNISDIWFLLACQPTFSIESKIKQKYKIKPKNI